MSSSVVVGNKGTMQLCIQQLKVAVTMHNDAMSLSAQYLTVATADTNT
jgi:hypothetical protein